MVSAQQLNDEKHLVASLLPKGGVGVEVGVHLGEFSRVLYYMSQPSRLYLVDPWQSRPDRPGSWYCCHQQEMDMRCLKVSFWATKHKAIVLRKQSNQAIGDLPSLDWAYIDGDHSFGTIKADLHLYWSLLLPGGCLAGDDYGHDNSWWGSAVTRAVNQFTRNTPHKSAQFFGLQYMIWKGK